MISPPKRKHPGWRAGAQRVHSKGRERDSKYNPNGVPESFWKGFAGTESMAPPINRRPAKPSDTFWNPARAGGAV
jgi:hypothetical protein